MVSNFLGSSHFLVMKADELCLGKELGELELGHVAGPILDNLPHQLEQGGNLQSFRFVKVFSRMLSEVPFGPFFYHSMLVVYSFG